MDTGANWNFEDASAATAGDEVRERLVGLFGGVSAEVMVDAVGEVVTGTGGEAAGHGADGGLRVEVIVGIIVVVVALDIFGDAVFVEAMLADLVLALLAGAAAKLLAVGVGLAAGK